MVLQENWQQVENSCGDGVFSLGGLENKRMYVGQVYVAVVHPLGGREEGLLTPKSIAWGVNLVTVWFCKKIGSKSRIVVETVFFH